MGDAVRERTFEADEVLAGRYRLVRLLGEGGMGFVWEARQITTDKAVAIKILKPRDGADAPRFLREAKLAAGLSHRNIVQVFDYWEVEAGGPVFLVMELLKGETLAALLERTSGALTLERALAICTEVGSGLRAAHALGVVHRDVKPENVFLAQAAGDTHVDVKVVDFGLAKPVVADPTATAVTQTGSVMGTPFYMSPEQVFGEKDIDERTDVWSFGVVLYECVTGQRPFPGDNFGQVFRAVTQESPRAPRELVPTIPPQLDGLVMAMLAKNRAQRPAMSHVCETLAAVTRTPPPPLAVPAAPVAPAVAPPVAPPPRASAGRVPATSVINPRPVGSAHPPAVLGATMMAGSTSVNAAPARGNPKVMGIAVLALAVLSIAVGTAVGLRASRTAAGSAPPSLPPVPPVSSETVAAPLPEPPPAVLDVRPAADPTVTSATTTAASSTSRPPPSSAPTRAKPHGGKLSPSPLGTSGGDPLGRGRF